MTREPVSPDDLSGLREQLFNDLPSALTDEQRTFLIGLVQGEPNWPLMSCAHLREMPAIRWKLSNLDRLRQSNPGKFSSQQSELRNGLEAHLHRPSWHLTRRNPHLNPHPHEGRLSTSGGRPSCIPYNQQQPTDNQ